MCCDLLIRAANWQNQAFSISLDNAVINCPADILVIQKDTVCGQNILNPLGKRRIIGTQKAIVKIRNQLGFIQFRTTDPILFHCGAKVAFFVGYFQRFLGVFTRKFFGILFCLFIPVACKLPRVPFRNYRRQMNLSGNSVLDPAHLSNSLPTISF